MKPDCDSTVYICNVRVAENGCACIYYMCIGVYVMEARARVHAYVSANRYSKKRLHVGHVHKHEYKQTLLCIHLTLSSSVLYRQQAKHGCGHRHRYVHCADGTRVDASCKHQHRYAHMHICTDGARIDG